MAAKGYPCGSMQNVLPFRRNASVNPQPLTQSEMAILTDYEMLRNHLKVLNADLAALKRQLGSLRG